MKTSIIISGSGISSKNTLLSACSTFNSELVKLGFNNFELQFNTKKEAIKALSEAYQYLHSDIEDWNNSSANYTRTSSISYDAGTAYITKTE